jgi:hypothetical protein
MLTRRSAVTSMYNLTWATVKGSSTNRPCFGARSGLSQPDLRTKLISNGSYRRPKLRRHTGTFA